MGFPSTVIEVVGPASDDVGWLNAGAQITNVHKTNHHDSRIGKRGPG